MLRNFIKAALSTAIAFGASSVQAEELQATDITEFVAMFSELCIDDFPNIDRMNAFLAKNSAVGMPQTEVQRYLKTDPGQAWYIKTPIALYAVTVEQPPYYTCAIRRMTPVGPDAPGIHSAIENIKAYALRISGSIFAIPPSRKISPTGLDITATAINIYRDRTPGDLFGIFITNYHGRAPESWRHDATPGVGVEVRLSRQFIHD